MSRIRTLDSKLILLPEFNTAPMSPESEPPLVAYTLQIISANDLPLRRLKVLGERNVIAKATVEGRTVTTKVCTCTSSAEWNETFQIEARNTSSVLSLRLSGSTHGTSLNCASDIKISDLLLRCRYEHMYGRGRLHSTNLFAVADAELDLRGTKSGLQGRIKVRLSPPKTGSWSADEAQKLALVLSREPNAAMAATGGCIDAVDGLLTISFPTPPAGASESIQNVLGKLENFMRIADAVAEVHPYAKVAWEVLSAAHKIIVAQVAIDQSVADLFQTMQDVYGFVDAIKAVPSKIQHLEKIIQRILIQTAECGNLIREYSGHGFGGRLLRETMGASTPAKVAEMAQSLTTLHDQFNTGVVVHIAVVCFRIQTDVATLVENQALDRLGSSGPDLGDFPCCLPGTRRDTIDEILGWASNPLQGDSDNVLWLYGPAGTGKSAVAATVATHFSEMGRLGAFVGFDRASPEQGRPSTAVKSLARQLAEYDGRLRTSITQTINDGPKASVLRASLSDKFDRLIVKPLASIPTLPGEGPIVVVLDGLYEYEQPDCWTSLLDLLVGGTKSLPSNLRFIITSRTVDGILDAVTGAVLHPHIRIRELRSSSHSDISAYFTFRMQQIRRKKTYLQEDWLGPTAIAELTARAFGYYPWASLLLQPLRSIPDLNTPLDELYRGALKSAGSWTDVDFVRDFRAAIGAILESTIAIPTTVIDGLLDRPFSPPPPPATVIIRRLGSVLTYEPVVRVLHPSFLDFLSNRERCGHEHWYFEHGPVRVSADPATLCLQSMNTGLTRTMDSMTLPTRLAKEVLPEDLAYACQSWAYHICPNGMLELSAMEMLVVFLRTHLLRWFDVMCLLNKSEEIEPMLQRVVTWSEENSFEDKSLGNIVMDALSFGRKVAADDTGPAILCLQEMNTGLKRNICVMTVSARPTTAVLPEALAYACQSWVDYICTKKTFKSREMEKLTVVFLRAHLLHWFEAMSILKKSEEIAPMLQRVATWLEENTFEDKSLMDLVIEAINFARKFATEIAEHPLYVYYTALPFLPSHSMLYQLFHDSLADPSVLLVTNPGTMFCLALSTNGRRIVTGYLHHAIVWDTATGEELVEMADTDGAVPLSVAFSYDGSRIACGTDKSTVYVWDSVTGARVIGPLSHSVSSEEVNVVAWSTDGECLLSGCHTGKVILWNITSPNDNQPITKIHHPGCISWADRLSSLVFSSDGSQISSCSRRGDVHVWDSNTGGIVWSVQDPQGSDPSGGVSFLPGDMREFLVVKTKERTQVRDTSTGDLCPLPDSLAGAVGLTHDDCIVNLLMKSIKKQYPQDGKNYVCPEWVVQGEYFAFAGYELCHVVHVPKSLCQSEESISTPRHY
ncbi:WD40 repeat-like protein [Athelia psychrophila]|uniref:WD40 repeat-like protein n=1 Tax=Athelia psychrophila TaxID=1759441 RepID=A0A166LPU7_9AGAM|nr:WD40 repeat-like protein [Fibularhizoctonia sp. CBS 109695]